MGNKGKSIRSLFRYIFLVSEEKQTFRTPMGSVFAGYGELLAIELVDEESNDSNISQLITYLSQQRLSAEMAFAKGSMLATPRD